MYNVATCISYIIHLTGSIHIINLNFIQHFHKWLSTPDDVWKTLIGGTAQYITRCRIKLYAYVCIWIISYKLICIYVAETYVTRHEKTGLMYTKYTYSYYNTSFTLELCKLHEISYKKLHKWCKVYFIRLL